MKKMISGMAGFIAGLALGIWAFFVMHPYIIFLVAMESDPVLAAGWWMIFVMLLLMIFDRGMKIVNAVVGWLISEL